MPKGRYSAQHHIPGLLEDAENGLPSLWRGNCCMTCINASGNSTSKSSRTTANSKISLAIAMPPSS